MSKTSINVTKLIHEHKILKQFMDEMIEDGDEFGIVHELGVHQAFRICFELAWKIMKHFLVMEGIKASSPRDVIKKAFTIKLIDRPELWLDFYEKHTGLGKYNQKKITAVVAVCDLFVLEIDKIIERMK